MFTPRAFRPARALLLLLSIVVPVSPRAAELPTISDPEIKACIDKTLPQRTLRQTVTLRSFDDSGLIEESVANMYWMRTDGENSRAVIRLTAPASRNGLAVLMIEGDDLEPTMYLYVPDLRRTRRIGGRQLEGSMMSTDFSYEEFAHFQKTTNTSDTKRIEDQAVNGASAYVLETVPGGENSNYSRILTFVEQARCVPLQTQFFTSDGELAKELLSTQDQIKQVGDRFVPYQVVMHDRKKNTRSELNIENLEIDVELSSTIFAPNRLGKAP